MLLVHTFLPKTTTNTNNKRIILISLKEKKVKLSDFGAAFFYDQSAKYGELIQQIELRSYAVLVEELQTLIGEDKTEQRWEDLKAACSESSATFGSVAKAIDF